MSYGINRGFAASLKGSFFAAGFFITSACSVLAADSNCGIFKTSLVCNGSHDYAGNASDRGRFSCKWDGKDCVYDRIGDVKAESGRNRSTGAEPLTEDAIAETPKP